MAGSGDLQCFFQRRALSFQRMYITHRTEQARRSVYIACRPHGWAQNKTKASAAPRLVYSASPRIAREVLLCPQAFVPQSKHRASCTHVPRTGAALYRYHWTSSSRSRHGSDINCTVGVILAGMGARHPRAGVPALGCVVFASVDVLRDRSTRRRHHGRGGKRPQAARHGPRAPPAQARHGGSARAPLRAAAALPRWLQKPGRALRARGPLPESSLPPRP